MMTYELWDIESKNMIGSYGSAEAAFAAVRAVIEANGERIIPALALGREDRLGRTTQIAQGIALAERAAAAGGHVEQLDATAAPGKRKRALAG